VKRLLEFYDGIETFFWLRKEERETYKMGIHPCMDLLYPSGKVLLFRLKGVGKLGLTDRG
jgi:hypothetical protein